MITKFFQNRAFMWRVFVIMSVSFILFGCNKNAVNLSQGKLYIDAKEWDKSVQFFQKAAKDNPNDTEIRLLLLRCRWEASRSHMAMGEKLFKNKLYDEAIKAFQISLAFSPNNPKVLEWIRRVKSTQKAEILLTQGEQNMKNNQLTLARDVFEKVLQLDSENQEAKRNLAAIAQQKKSPFENLVLESREPISLKFKKTPIINIFEMLSRLTGVNFIFDKDIVDTKVSLFMTDVSFTRFLEMLLQTNQLEATIIDEKTVLVYPDSASKRKEYQELQIRTFYLANLEAKRAKNLLSRILNSKEVTINEKFNAVVVRGPYELIQLAEKVIEANDRPMAEVILNVEILEVNRVKEKQLGLEVDPASVGVGVGESSPEPNNETLLTPLVSYYALHKMSSKEVLFSVPTATLHFLKQDGDTKTLANPQIRARNNEKATIHIGERVPIRTNRRIDTSGNVTSDFQYQDIGVKLEAVPSINVKDEIALKLTLEVSSLGQNVGTVDEPQYSIKTRTAKSVLTMLDGEAVVIGGLINDEERETSRKVPFLGKLPLIGRLFSSYGDNASKTDILMSITPTVIRSQEYPEYSSTHIWSGTENRVSTQRQFLSVLDSQKQETGQKNEGDIQSSQKKLSAGYNQDSEKQADPPVSSQSTLPLPVDEAYSEEPKPYDALMSQENSFFWPSSIPYSIHVNSYPQKTLAEKRLRELHDLGYTCYLTYTQIPEKGNYYRVFVGNYKNLQMARRACRQLKNRKEFATDIHVADRKWSFGG